MSAKTPEHTENQCPFHAERSGEVREVGGQAVWSLSSCKPGELNFHHFVCLQFLTICIISLLRIWR